MEIENKRIGLSLIVKIAFGMMQGFVPVMTVYGCCALIMRNSLIEKVRKKL